MTELWDSPRLSVKRAVHVLFCFVFSPSVCICVSVQMPTEVEKKRVLREPPNTDATEPSMGRPEERVRS